MIRLKDEETGDSARLFCDCCEEKTHSLIPIGFETNHYSSRVDFLSNNPALPSHYRHDGFETKQVTRLLCERCFKVFSISESENVGYDATSIGSCASKKEVGEGKQ